MKDNTVGMIVFGSMTLLALVVAGIGSLVGHPEITSRAELAACIGGFWTFVLAVPFVAERI